ncbi:hypothetical protein CFC21_013192 [Triticum aestivum]|uniref:Auxin-responsive protein n=3 Tax=Triticinae TaxID=1648030 RepID=A0A452ZL92_AEGTS|nr:auxin-responsive protein IAA18 isoform X1 [Aegilops tauschii subsp. strangulata]KAF6996917.1 hypothetical protein CFC21_013192 [Triticum aestivum]
MEQGTPPRLLNLIPDDKGWQAREAQAGHGGTRSTLDAEHEEGKELDLKLGLPGVRHQEEAVPGPVESCSAVSLARFATHSCLTTGAKRGFFDAVGAKPQDYDRRQQEDREGCAPVHSSRDPQGRAAVVPVVGWPPVRSFRRNLTNGTSSKQSPERQNVEATDRAKPVCKKKPLIKINMDGIPIGRKVDLASCDSYHKLSTAVEELFQGFLEAQKDLSFDESGVRGAEEKIFSGLLDGTGEYALVYEDDEGDRMLVGDIPWSVFVSTAKRLRVMRRSELPQRMLSSGANSTKVADC